MPNNILQIIVKGSGNRTIADNLVLLKYWNTSNPMSREFYYAYQLSEIFK